MTDYAKLAAEFNRFVLAEVEESAVHLRFLQEVDRLTDEFMEHRGMDREHAYELAQNSALHELQSREVQGNLEGKLF